MHVQGWAENHHLLYPESLMTFYFHIFIFFKYENNLALLVLYQVGVPRS